MYIFLHRQLWVFPVQVYTYVAFSLELFAALVLLLEYPYSPSQIELHQHGAWCYLAMKKLVIFEECFEELTKWRVMSCAYIIQGQYCCQKYIVAKSISIFIDLFIKIYLNICRWRPFHNLSHQNDDHLADGSFEPPHQSSICGVQFALVSVFNMSIDSKKQTSSALDVDKADDEAAKFGSRLLRDRDQVFEYNAW